MPSALNRRALLLGGALAVTATCGFRRPASAQGAAAGPHTLPPLPYAPDANEAAIDARTMELHHGAHHRSYVNSLNEALREHSALQGMPLDELLAKLGQVPESVRTRVRNNGGGHANHSMFWEIMGGRGGEPSGELMQAIRRDFEGWDRFRERFEQASTGIFGSGWAFVTVDREGKLEIVQKPNQDTPLMEGKRVLMGNDVWEHAYYLRYQNRRAEYVRNWWNVLNWERIGERYAAARAGNLRI
ncbi:superoxide dismutase [Crenalkalicoccus roseus]|uniref:superoxide dismutase n=1 Tax=Crenalkalicoccus roseus TaxID=1485588 RepID=UPI001080E2B1|nr:superoxide dismutase [Crenalkalicoccus roseus]